VVNEVSRIAATCRSAERSVLVSSAIAAALPATERDKLVGAYALRGVGRAQELFTLDPAALLPSGVIHAKVRFGRTAHEGLRLDAAAHGRPNPSKLLLKDTRSQGPVTRMVGMFPLP